MKTALVVVALCSIGFATGLSVIPGWPTDRSVTLSVLSVTNTEARIENGYK